MDGNKRHLALISIIGSSLIVLVIILCIKEQQTTSTAIPSRLHVVQAQPLTSDSLRRIYQSGRVDLESNQQIWWSEDSRSIYFQAFQNIWEYCLFCVGLKQVKSRYSTDQVIPPEPKLEELSGNLIKLDLNNTELTQVSQNTRSQKKEISKWDGLVAYQESGSTWKLGGYIDDDALLIEWIDFSQIPELKGYQPVQGKISPDGRWVAFAAGVDGDSFESIWLLYIETSQ